MDHLDIPGILRRGRRRADMSQRDLAQAAGKSTATVGGVESGELVPSLRTLQHLLYPLGFRLAVLDPEGQEVAPYDGDQKRNAAGRLYPAHLDVRPVGPRGEGWWGRWTVMPWQRPQPEHTFDLCRLRRDDRRHGTGAAALPDENHYPR